MPTIPTEKKRNFTPPGKRPNNFDRRFDKTQLKSTGHGRTVHRDYAAHFFRWGFIYQRVVQKKTRILDIGCGQESPLARVISSRLSSVPDLYVGIDLNRIMKPFKVNWGRIHDQFNFIDNHKELVKEYGQTFNLITCFEVIEHMHPKDGFKLLMNASDLAKPGAEMILSTPVYNQKKMAANHLHEYTIDELTDLILSVGRWKIMRRYGTFASWNDIKKVLTPAERKLYEELHEYYDHEVLSCFFAPKYPDSSRNNAWVLRRK